MKTIKDELQNIILGDEQVGSNSQLKKVQIFLRRYAEASHAIKEEQRFKDEETTALIDFAKKENLFYNYPILEKDFISEGAEQRVYRFDDFNVVKTNQSIFTKPGLIISIVS